MKNAARVVVGVSALLWGGLAAYAHHSFGGTYLLAKEITIEGELVRVLLRNPHSFIHVAVPDETGRMQEWAVEWTGAPALARSGIGRDTFKAGDPVVITGNPARTPGEPRMRLIMFKRTSDGFTWGGRPDEVVD